MGFLRPLSMTCRAMRLRLIPWIWERLELFPQRLRVFGSDGVQKLEMILDALRGDAYLAITVK